MEAINGWNESGQKVTLIRDLGRSACSRTPWDPSRAVAVTRFDVQRAFNTMLTVARIVADSFRDGATLDNDPEIGPVRNLYLWHSTCSRFVQERQFHLRTARLKLPTPADYPDTQTTPFCDLAVQTVGRLIRQLWHFVQTREIPEEQQVQAASERGEKLATVRIPANDLLRLVILELDELHWPGERYGMQDILDSIGCEDSRTVHPYILSAGFAKPGRGKKSWTIDRDQYLAVLREIAADPNSAFAAKAEQLLTAHG